jgi:hypothetical protein
MVTFWPSASLFLGKVPHCTHWWASEPVWTLWRMVICYQVLYEICMTVFFIFHSIRGSSVVCVDVFRVVHTDFREIADVVAHCFANKKKC